MGATGRANPDVIVEDGPLRDELYAKLVAIKDQFADHETKTARRIPVVVLDRSD